MARPSVAHEEIDDAPPEAVALSDARGAVEASSDVNMAFRAPRRIR